MTFSNIIEEQLKSPTAFIQAKTVNTFVLDSDDFKNLRAYLVAASLFPHNEATFATIYPKALLTEDVPTVDYDDLMTNLPIIHEHCITFRTNTIAPLIVLAGEIVNFAESATSRFNEIHDELTIILANVDATKVAASHREVLELVKRLGDDAEVIKEGCNKLSNQLTKFREITITDKQTITRLNNKLITHEKKARESVHTVTEKQKEAQANAKKDLQKFEVPAEDSVLIILKSITNPLYSPKALAKDLMRHHMAKVQKYSTLLAADQAKLAKLEASLTEALAKQVSNVDLAIQGALQSVLHLSGTCQHMESQFKGLKSYINFIEPGKSRVLKDLKILADKWKTVEDVAKSFELAGLVEISDE